MGSRWFLWGWWYTWCVLNFWEDGWSCQPTLSSDTFSDLKEPCAVEAGCDASCNSWNVQSIVEYIEGIYIWIYRLYLNIWVRNMHILYLTNTSNIVHKSPRKWFLFGYLPSTTSASAVISEVGIQIQCCLVSINTSSRLGGSSQEGRFGG